MEVGGIGCVAAWECCSALTGSLFVGWFATHSDPPLKVYTHGGGVHEVEMEGSDVIPPVWDVSI